MVDLQAVERQLHEVGCNYRLLGRAEVRELATILFPGETIAQAVMGTYDGGFGMLVVTDTRLLLIDRKPMFLTLEDIRYDMVAEIDYNYRLLMGSVRICTPNKELSFSSWSQSRLRTLAAYLQQKIMELRQHGDSKQADTPVWPAAAGHGVATSYAVWQAAVAKALGRTAFTPNGASDFPGGSLYASAPAGRLVTPPRMTNPYARQALPLSRRRVYPST